MIVLVVRIDVCEMRDKENLCFAKTTLALALSPGIPGRCIASNGRPIGQMVSYAT